MLALLWGSLAASSLLIGSFLAIRFNLSSKLVALIVAFGVGALISSVAFELIFEASSMVDDFYIIALMFLAGAFVFFIGDTIIDNFGGAHRKSQVAHPNNNGLAVLFGTILDAIPESIVIGLGLASGEGLSVAMFVAVFLANLPEALSSSTGMLSAGWGRMRIFTLWVFVVLISGLSSLFGYTVLAGASEVVQASMLAFAGGAILTMLSDTMLPEAYRVSGKLTGLVVSVGFCFSYALSL